MINQFLTRIPFFKAKGIFDSIDDLLALQVNRAVCTNIIKAPLNPHDWLPEFIAATDLSLDEIDWCKIYTAEFTIHSTFDAGQLAAITSHDAVVNGVSKTVLMFNGVQTSETFECGKQYFYVIARGEERYYSDFWEGGNFGKSQTPRDIIQLKYKGTDCTIGGILYSLKPNFTNYIWLRSELILPENETEITNDENNEGEVVATTIRVMKRYRVVIGQCVDPLYDALSTINMYLNKEGATLEATVPDMNEPFVTVQDFKLDKPDYKTDECMPVVRFDLSIQEKITEEGCCTTEDILCFSGRTFALPSLSVATPGEIVVTHNATFAPVQECWMQIAYKPSAVSSFITVNVLRSQLASGYVIGGLAAGSYQVKTRVLASTSECYSEYCLVQSVTVT